MNGLIGCDPYLAPGGLDGGVGSAVLDLAAAFAELVPSVKVIAGVLLGSVGVIGVRSIEDIVSKSRPSLRR